MIAKEKAKSIYSAISLYCAGGPTADGVRQLRANRKAVAKIVVDQILEEYPDFNNYWVDVKKEIDKI